MLSLSFIDSLDPFDAGTAHSLHVKVVLLVSAAILTTLILAVCLLQLVSAPFYEFAMLLFFFDLAFVFSCVFVVVIKF